MKHHQAYILLAFQKRTTVISKVFDRGDFGEAFLTLLPGFEYPNWSYRTIGEFLHNLRFDTKNS